MNKIFINLKRWEVPRRLGGVCPEENPEDWIRGVIRETLERGLGGDDLELIYLLPEGLLVPARDELSSYEKQTSRDEKASLFIGCQGVFRENVTPGGNFGALTTNLPAAAASVLGARWVIVGHSEERKDKFGMLSVYDPRVKTDDQARADAQEAVNVVVNQEVLRGLESGLDVLLCVGETAEERGTGSFEEQKPRIKAALRGQLQTGLAGVVEHIAERTLVVGYEPVWAIGPGRTPPGGEYIDFVAAYIKEACEELYGIRADVVYGGGLKRENAGEIGSLANVDGGLVALTRFVEPVGFDTGELSEIIDTYRAAKGLG